MERAKNGSEVAKELGITKQAVSSYTKNALGKLYKWLPERGITNNPRDTFLALVNFFNISVDEDIKEFLGLFPRDIQKEIKDYVWNY